MLRIMSRAVLGAAVAALAAVPVIGISGAAVAHAAPAPTSVPAVVSLPGRVVYARGPERHVEVRKAIAQLERAKYDLQHAAHDFGGHRVDAIQACDNAIALLRIALQYDSK